MLIEFVKEKEPDIFKAFDNIKFVQYNGEADVISCTRTYLNQLYDNTALATQPWRAILAGITV
jgi:hypothetical protein